MKTVFITGGRGFIGRNITEALQLLGYRVLVPSSAELNLLDEQYRSGQGGGAHIVDKYRLKNEPQEELNEQEGQRLSAA